MCNYQTLVHNNNGYIIKCIGCGHLQLAFGTIVSSLDEELFNATAANIANEYRYHTPSAEPRLKRISIPLDSHTMLCLTYHELEKLNDMFIQAQAILETYQILEHC